MKIQGVSITGLQADVHPVKPGRRKVFYRILLEFPQGGYAGIGGQPPDRQNRAEVPGDFNELIQADLQGIGITEKYCVRPGTALPEKINIMLYLGNRAP